MFSVSLTNVCSVLFALITLIVVVSDCLFLGSKHGKSMRYSKHGSKSRMFRPANAVLIGEYPSFVNARKSNGFAFSGALVEAFDIVMTAASNVKDFPEVKIDVAASVYPYWRWDVNNVESRRVIDKCVSEDFDASNGFPTSDLALLLLETPFDDSNRRQINIAEYETDPAQVYAGSNLVGIGMLEYNKSLGWEHWPGAAHRAYYEHEDCADKNDPSVSCWHANENGSPCVGDRGAPLYNFYTNKLNGILSYWTTPQDVCIARDEDEVGVVDISNIPQTLIKMVQECVQKRIGRRKKMG